MRPSRFVGSKTRAVMGSAIAVVVMLCTASPVAAHGSVGSDSTNYRTQVDQPGDPGLMWEVFGGDALLQLTNSTGEEVTVLGYEGEPYLRFSPGDGVYENVRSPAAYLNQDRFATTALPSDVDAQAAPQWRRVVDGDDYAWHDHRAHWMAPVRPAEVDADPSVAHLVLVWSIPVTIGDTDPRRVDVTGELRWEPPVAWWPPILMLACLFIVVTVVAAARTRPVASVWSGLARPVTVLLWTVLAANVVRTIDDVVSAPATIGEQLWLGGIALIGLGAIAGLSFKSWVGHAMGFATLAAAGVLTMLIFGGESSAQLSASQLVTAFPNWVRRWTVAGSYVIVAPTLLAAVLAARNYKLYLDQHPDISPGFRTSSADTQQPETTTPS